MTATKHFIYMGDAYILVSNRTRLCSLNVHAQTGVSFFQASNAHLLWKARQRVYATKRQVQGRGGTVLLRARRKLKKKRATKEFDKGKLIACYSAANA